MQHVKMFLCIYNYDSYRYLKLYLEFLALLTPDSVFFLLLLSAGPGCCSLRVQLGGRSSSL